MVSMRPDCIGTMSEKQLFELESRDFMIGTAIAASPGADPDSIPDRP